MTTSLSISVPDHYDLAMTCHSHGWKHLSPFGWEEANQSLNFAASVKGRSVDISVSQRGDQIHAVLDCTGERTASFVKEAENIVTRSLSLDVETGDILKTAERFNPDYAELIKKGAGRLLRSPTLWEDAAKTLFTTNCTWALTCQMAGAACSAFFSEPAPSGAYPFPGPEKIAGLSGAELKKLIPIGYRADYLVELASRFADDPGLQQIESGGYSYKDADKLVRSIKGFGNYATAHLLIMSGYFNEIPVDTVVVAYLKKYHRVRKPQSFINRTYGKWGKYKWWGLRLEQLLARETE